MEIRSSVCGKLCSVLLLEHYGSIVQNVAMDLFKSGNKSLNLIRSNTKLPLSKVKEALCVLIKHGFVSYAQNNKGILTYKLDVEKILLILRYSRFIFFVKDNCGDESEMMFEEILKHGYETASHVIIKIYKRQLCNRPERQYSLPVLKEKFELLVQNQFLLRSVCSNKCSDEGPADKQDFSLPNLDLKSLTLMAKGTNADPGDNKIYWRVNFDRFAQDLRDQLLISAITKRVDENAGELMRRMLYQMYLRTASWADTSNPIPYTELKEVIKKLENPGLGLVQYLDQYLHLIEEDSCQFIRKVGDSSGGQFSINMKEAINQLAWATIENIVMERFGSKAARVFRLIRAQKFIEQEKIQQMAMTPAKETKHITYTLLQENYIQLQEVRKPGVSAAPMKTFFLFHIDLDQVVRMEIEHCYHALHNTIQRREHEITTNKRMIDKHLKIQTLTATFKEKGATQEQLEEMESMMTLPEKTQLEKVTNQVKQLGVSELQIDDTLFLLSTYLRYNVKKKETR